MHALPASFTGRPTAKAGACGSVVDLFVESTALCANRQMPRKIERTDKIDIAVRRCLQVVSARCRKQHHTAPDLAAGALINALTPDFPAEARLAVQIDRSGIGVWQSRRRHTTGHAMNIENTLQPPRPRTSVQARIGSDTLLPLRRHAYDDRGEGGSR